MPSLIPICGLSLAVGATFFSYKDGCLVVIPILSSIEGVLMLVVLEIVRFLSPRLVKVSL